MRAPLIAALLLAPFPALADDITDALNGALQSYADGEIADALDDIAYATQLLNALQAQGLSALLPDPLAGWTREVNDNAAASLGFMGGGAAAEATYQGPDGRFTVTIMADNPMVMSMAAVLGNSAVMASMGQIVRINRENFLNSDGEISGLIGGRIMIQASGGPEDAMVAHLEQIDFDALEDFGR